MKKDITSDYLGDITSYAKDAISFTKDISFEKFAKDKKTTYAVVRSIEVIGEAARKLPKDFRDKHSSIPWTEIVGMRDKLIHDYSGIDLDIVWKTVKEDLPKILKQISKII